MAKQHDVRVGVIGVGALGYHHVRILREVPGARVGRLVEGEAGTIAVRAGPA